MKKNLLIIFAAVLGITFSAFTLKPAKKSNNPDPEYWFILQSGGTASNPLHYSLVGDGSFPPDCPSPTTYRCAILTEKQGPSDPNPGYPFVNTASQTLKRSTP
jgi:hypothetical protein